MLAVLILLNPLTAQYGLSDDPKSFEPGCNLLEELFARSGIGGALVHAECGRAEHHAVPGDCRRRRELGAKKGGQEESFLPQWGCVQPPRRRVILVWFLTHRGAQAGKQHGEAGADNFEPFLLALEGVLGVLGRD